VVDRPLLFMCLRDAAEPGWPEAANPLPPDGLPYGRTQEVVSDWTLSAASIEVVLVAGRVDQVQGLSCGELISTLMAKGPSRQAFDAGLVPRDSGSPQGEATVALVDAAAEGGPGPLQPEPFVLPESAGFAGSLLLSPGVLSSAGRYLLVASGCVGAGATPPAALCGPPEPVLGGTLSTALLRLAALPPENAAGVQFVNASRAVSRAGLELQLEGDRRLQLANDVPFGTLRPRLSPPVSSVVGSRLSVDSGPASYVEPWSNTLRAAQLEQLEPGRTYVLIYAGPNPAEQAAGVGNPPRFVLVPGD
jgi:hypothetical protein